MWLLAKHAKMVVEAVSTNGCDAALMSSLLISRYVVQTVPAAVQTVHAAVQTVHAARHHVWLQFGA